MTARDAILRRVREALGPAPVVPEVPRGYRVAGVATADVDRFCRRVADYRATVHRVQQESLTILLSELLAGCMVAIPAELAWRPDGAEIVEDAPPLANDALDRVDAVLTGCALAVADTGTIVLDGGTASGRRALTLIPDRHVCVVLAAQLVAALPDAVALLSRDRPITFVSGPSATSDIELERVEGVHGPRRLEIVVVEGPPAGQVAPQRG
jgi:L-lactate dehydrogenase complex protein LldG